MDTKIILGKMILALIMAIGTMLLLTVFILAIVAILKIKKFKRFKNWFYMVWMELWHVKIVNGRTRFQFSSKKFWFQMANFLLYTAIVLKMCGVNPEHITVELIGYLTAHTAAIGGWYAWRKNKDIEVQSKMDKIEGDYTDES